MDSGRSDPCAEHAQHIAAHNLADIGFRKACCQQGLSHRDDLARVKAGRGRTVEIRAEPDIIDPDEIADMGDGPRLVLRIGRADRAPPVADADHATGFGNGFRRRSNCG